MAPPLVSLSKDSDRSERSAVGGLDFERAHDGSIRLEARLFFVSSREPTLTNALLDHVTSVKAESSPTVPREVEAEHPEPPFGTRVNRATSGCCVLRRNVIDLGWGIWRDRSGRRIVTEIGKS